MFAVMILLIALSWWYDSVRDAAPAGDPVAVIAKWTETDRDLGSALAAADQGNPAPLATWLNRADEQQRLNLAAVLYRLVALGGGEDQDKDPISDDRVAYRYRDRLRAFLNVSIGNDRRDVELNHTMDNLLAYTVVAGTERPTELDLEIARELLPRLEARMKDHPDHAVFDTIGCVRFAFGEYALSRDAFAESSRLFAADRSLTELSWFANERERRFAKKMHAHLTALYGRRLSAATANAVRTGTAPLVPLPRDWPGAETSPSVPAPAPAPATPPAPVTPPAPAAATPTTPPL
jgi:hypothetical protein